jgi:hypothetical protein
MADHQFVQSQCDSTAHRYPCNSDCSHVSVSLIKQHMLMLNIGSDRESSKSKFVANERTDHVPRRAYTGAKI